MQPRLKKPLYAFWTFASILQQLTLQVRKHRDVRPNDGFLRQLVEFDTRYCSPEILLQSYGRLNLCINGENLKRQILIILSLFRLKSERGLLASTARAWMDCLLWFDFSDLTSPPNPSPAPPPPPPAPPPPPPPAPPPSSTQHRQKILPDLVLHLFHLPIFSLLPVTIHQCVQRDL